MFVYLHNIRQGMAKVKKKNLNFSFFRFKFAVVAVQNLILQVPLAQITWYHHISLIPKVKDILLEMGRGFAFVEPYINGKQYSTIIKRYIFQ